MISMGDVLAAVAAEFAVPVEAIRGRRKTQQVAWARQAAMWVARRHTAASLPRIGQLLRRDHSTVLHGVRATEARIATDPDVAQAMLRVQQRLGVGP